VAEPGLSRHVATRRVGAVAVTIVSDGTLRWAPELQAPEDAWRRAMPEADASGALTFSMNVAHLGLGMASVLVDLGFDEPGPTSRWPAAARSPGLVAGLAEIGVRPEDVTHVLLTHPHGDHVAGGTVERGGQRVARFPRARHLLGRADWEAVAGAPPGSDAAVHLGTLARLGLLEPAAGDDSEIVPGLALVHAPGESPGHSIVRLRSGGETFYFLGDLFHHPCEVEHTDWVSPGRDRAAMQASRERLIRDALAADALLVFSHGRFPGWGRIEAASGGARWVWLT
jgi:glyoxylase-like metal-dependent hydrolase (beta-lactamase superfamily II)